MDIKIIIAIVVAVLLVAGGVIWFVKLPKDQKIKNLKEWLKWAVVAAEKALGSGTGQLKLRMVYDMAIKEFPWLAGMVKFDDFSAWVDEALEWMRQQLDENRKIKDYIIG